MAHPNIISILSSFFTPQSAALQQRNKQLTCHKYRAWNWLRKTAKKMSFSIFWKMIMQRTHYKAHLKAPIIWMFVRVSSDFVPLFLKFRTTSSVALANKSSDRLEARDAEDKKNAAWNLLYPLGEKIVTNPNILSFSKGNGLDWHHISHTQF